MLRTDKLEKSKTLDFALSSLCTKLMQLNAGMERLDDISINAMGNRMQNMTTATANKFIMHSILDEFNLNDSEMPAPKRSIDIARDHQNNNNNNKSSVDNRIGFISHIVSETMGSVYILDVQRMPDPLVLFGCEPKRLTAMPAPGEMFGYVFQEKYLVRAIRQTYESEAELLLNNQFSAQLIDIGCVVRINVKPLPRSLYRVNEGAKSIPAYATLCRLVEIPDKMTIYDLLHTRIQYNVLFVYDGMTYVAIPRTGINPFDTAQQNEWNFYKYFIGYQTYAPNIKLAVKKPPTPTPIQSIDMPNPAKLLIHHQYDQDLNPFSNPSSYEIKNIPLKPLIDQTNPFYSLSLENLSCDDIDIAADPPVKPKFANFRLTKILYQKKSTNGHGDNSTSLDSVDSKSVAPNAAVQLKRVNGMNYKINSINGEMNGAAQHVAKIKIEIDTESDAGTALRKVSMDDSRCRQQQSQPIAKLSECNPSNVVDTPAPTPPAPLPLTPSPPIQFVTNKSPTSTRAAETIESSKDFPQPKQLPSIGDRITVLYQSMESVETFYATIVNDPNHEMSVHEFDATFNQFENTKSLKPYSAECTPKLHDKVIALYENSYYRAKVINIIDKHVFQVFYVDYGNCAIVPTRHIFKYDTKWDVYATYVLHFRINGIQETHPCDHIAKVAIEKIMMANCTARIIGSERCDKINRTTYVCDVYDEMGLNVAETLVHKNFATYTGKRANQQQSPITRKSKHA